MMHSVDHGTRAHKQQSLKESVGHHVEDGSNVRARANSEEHESQLRHRRVRKDFLNVRLRDSNRCRKQSCQSTDRCNDIARPWVCRMKNWSHASEQEHA